jgi:hypothetical protein
MAHFCSAKSPYDLVQSEPDPHANLHEARAQSGDCRSQPRAQAAEATAGENGWTERGGNVVVRTSEGTGSECRAGART